MTVSPSFLENSISEVGKSFIMVLRCQINPVSEKQIIDGSMQCCPNSIFNMPLFISNGKKTTGIGIGYATYEYYSLHSV